jgi:hypothetical protein
MSSPSIRINCLNQQKISEIKLSAKWHTSYAQSATIKTVEKTTETKAVIKDKSPAIASGFSCCAAAKIVNFLSE